MTQAELEQMYQDGEITLNQLTVMQYNLARLERIVYPPTGPVAETPVRNRVGQISDEEFYTLQNDGPAAWRAYVVATANAPDDIALAVL